MVSNNNFKVLGKIADSQKNIIAQEFIQAFSKKYPSVRGELYLGYPIYIDEIANRQTCVDIALISHIGVYIIKSSQILSLITVKFKMTYTQK